MDSVIDLFEAVKLGNTDLVDSLSESISSMVIIDPEHEWKTLQENYSKLKYLKQLIKELSEHKYSKYFHNPLVKFMDKIIEVNQYYLKNLNLDPRKYPDTSTFNQIDLESLHELITLIRKHLEDSLSTNDPIQKLENTITAYSHLVVLAEDVRGEKITEYLDPRFIDDFNPVKRQKK